MIAAWGSAAAMVAGTLMVLPWAFGNNSRFCWRAAGWGMLAVGSGLVALVAIGLSQP